MRARRRADWVVAEGREQKESDMASKVAQAAQRILVALVTLGLVTLGSELKEYLYIYM